MIRKTRKIRKLRGTRTNGGGNSKMRRGAGHRGGRGHSGLQKHMWSWVVKYDPHHFGKYGFKRPQKTIYKFKPVNLSYLDEKLDELLERGIAKEENGKIVIDVTDLGYNKVLGTGKITKSVVVKSPKFSESAVEKIENAGGQAETL